jgi:hypothetical protein
MLGQAPQAHGSLLDGGASHVGMGSAYYSRLRARVGRLARQTLTVSPPLGELPALGAEVDAASSKEIG